MLELACGQLCPDGFYYGPLAYIPVEHMCECGQERVVYEYEVPLDVALSYRTKPNSRSSMQGIGDLPVELLISITNQISRKDVLNLRLCAPRNILPFINAIVFKEIHLLIDTTDHLEQSQLEEKEGVALQRLVDVSQSRIVEHVHVLVLKVANTYNLTAARGKSLFALLLPSLLMRS